MEIDWQFCRRPRRVCDGSSKTGRLRLFVGRCLAFVALSRFLPVLRALVDLRLRHAHDFLCELAESLKSFFVWRFGFLHLFVAFTYFFECNTIYAKDHVAHNVWIVHSTKWQRVSLNTKFVRVFS